VLAVGIAVALTLGIIGALLAVGGAALIVTLVEGPEATPPGGNV